MVGDSVVTNSLIRGQSPGAPSLSVCYLFRQRLLMGAPIMLIKKLFLTPT